MNLSDDAQHYLVEVIDYALNVGTYRLNLNKEELEDPEISLTLDKTDFEIIGKNSVQLTATISPWGVADDVTWTSSDPAVATVNGRGMVTGVETGDAMFYLWVAAGKAAPTLTESPYSDVTDPGAYYCKAALWTWEQGVEKGADGRFNGKADCLRESVVLWMYRVLEKDALAE